MRVAYQAWLKNMRKNMAHVSISYHGVLTRRQHNVASWRSGNLFGRWHIKRMA